MNFKNIFNTCARHVDKALDFAADLFDTAGQYSNSTGVGHRALAPIAATYRTQAPQGSRTLR